MGRAQALILCTNETCMEVSRAEVVRGRHAKGVGGRVDARGGGCQGAQSERSGVLLQMLQCPAAHEARTERDNTRAERKGQCNV